MDYFNLLPASGHPCCGNQNTAGRKSSVPSAVRPPWIPVIRGFDGNFPAVSLNPLYTFDKLMNAITLQDGVGFVADVTFIVDLNDYIRVSVLKHPFGLSDPSGAKAELSQRCSRQ